MYRITLYKVISFAFVVSMFVLSAGFITKESGPITQHSLYELTIMEVGQQMVCPWGIVAMTALFIFIVGYLFNKRYVVQAGAILCIVVWSYAFGLLVSHGYYVEALAFPLLHVVYWSSCYYRALSRLDTDSNTV